MTRAIFRIMPYLAALAAFYWVLARIRRASARPESGGLMGIGITV